MESLDISDDDVEQQLTDALGEEFSLDALGEMIQEKITHEPGKILVGHVVGIAGDDVVVEVGLKSEGLVPISEFGDKKDTIEPGMEVEVFLEAVESDGGLVVLSKRKADRIRGWEWIVSHKSEGDVVTGVATRKIKGGLLVDIGVPAFLPASQVDIRRPSDIGEFLGKEMEAKILKIDEDRHNIVISRRKLIEEQRAEAREKLLTELEVGQVRKGVVKNIADFGVFVDMGGLDGLLHITDMSWGRINHPSEMVKNEEDIEVMILSIDHEKGKVALGLKQKSASPWENIEGKYPVGTKIKGTVVSLMAYGAFVKIEDGLEGLVHISEMSWTRRINHPSEMVSVAEEIDVVILDIDMGKEEISLGMKQAETNPWTLVKEKYPPWTVITGRVRNMTNFGAFVEIEEGIDGMLHISDLSWTKKIGHPSELLKKGEEVKCVVLAVDEEKMRVSLGLKQLTEDPWLRSIPDHYLPGQIVKGHVTKITNFGVFVELEDDLEGLLHISELADHKVESPQEIVKIDDELEVKILRVDSEDRKIGLSLKRAQWAAEDAPEGSVPDAQIKRRKGGLAGEGGMLGEMGDQYIKSIREQEAENAAAEEAPAEEAPAEEAPAEEAVAEEAPAEEAPVEEAVAEEAPAEEAPAEEAPVEDAPVEDAPVEEAPAEEAPAEEAVAEEAPAEEAPAEEAPAEEAPAEEAPAEEAPAEEAPAEEASAEEAPAEEAVAEEAPAEEAPADEAADEDTGEDEKADA
jgi:small subunit ribosomal protein S1